MKLLSIALFTLHKELRRKYILFMALDLGEIINGIAFVTVGIGRADLFVTDSLYRTISVRRCMINKPWPIMLLIGAQLPALLTILISFERILAVLFPHFYSRICGKYTKLICIAVCAGTVAMSILVAYLVSEQDREQWKTQHCPIISSVTKYYATAHFLFIFCAYSFSFSSLLVLKIVQSRLKLSETIRKETRLTLYLWVTGFYLVCLSIPAVVMLCIRWEIYDIGDFLSSLSYMLPGIPAIATTLVNLIFRKDYRNQTMTRSILILTLVVLTTVYAAPLECVEERTTGLMNDCYTTFANAYGVPSPVTPLADYFSDAGFHKKRTALLEKDGIAAKPDMKDYGVGLTTCLSTVANCIEDATYELPAVGVVTPGDGHRYNTDRLITAYQTSDRGYEIQMRHFYALRACADTQGAALDQCDAVLDASPKACKDYSDNMQCYKNIFTTCCGSECGEFQCNSVGAEYTIFMKTALADGTCTFANCA